MDFGMSILARYMARAWLRMLALCLGSFLSVYLVLDMMDKIPRFLRFGAAAKDMLAFFCYKLPEMIGQTASFSILMATLLTLGLLSRSSEIIAMRSCGVSLFKISLPMLLLGLAAALARSARAGSASAMRTGTVMASSAAWNGYACSTAIELSPKERIGDFIANHHG